MKRILIILSAIFPGVTCAAVDTTAISNATSVDAAVAAYQTTANQIISQNANQVPTSEINAAKEIVSDNVTAAQSATPDTVADAETPAANTGSAPTTSETSIEIPPTNAHTLKNQKLSELQDNAQAMRDKEQSAANKLLGAATTAATSMGAQQLFENTARANAQAEAERAMKAYLETFRCSYGNTGGIRGGTMDIELPGGNEMFELYGEYVALANQLKKDKANLGLRPGIESQDIINSADTGLYDDVGTGIVSGAYTSIARALQNPEGEDAAAWAAAREKTQEQKKTGAIVAASGIAAGIIGNLAINANGPKESSTAINNKYSKMMSDLEASIANQTPAPTQCPRNATGTYAPDCTCKSETQVYNANSNTCDQCGEYEINDGNVCTCKSNYVRNTVTGKCVLKKQSCNLTGTNIILKTDGSCSCESGYSVGPTNTCVAIPVASTATMEPAPVPNTPTSTTISLSSEQLFERSSATLSPAASKTLEEFASDFKSGNFDQESYCINIVGQTDYTGNEKYNNTLSQQRADAVAQELKKRGLTNVKTSGIGWQGCPVPASNAKSKANKNCRRVVVTVSSTRCANQI